MAARKRRHLSRRDVAQPVHARASRLWERHTDAHPRNGHNLHSLIAPRADHATCATDAHMEGSPAAQREMQLWHVAQLARELLRQQKPGEALTRALQCFNQADAELGAWASAQSRARKRVIVYPCCRSRVAGHVLRASAVGGGVSGAGAARTHQAAVRACRSCLLTAACLTARLSRLLSLVDTALEEAEQLRARDAVEVAVAAHRLAHVACMRMGEYVAARDIATRMVLFMVGGARGDHRCLLHRSNTRRPRCA